MKEGSIPTPVSLLPVGYLLLQETILARSLQHLLCRQGSWYLLPAALSPPRTNTVLFSHPELSGQTSPKNSWTHGSGLLQVYSLIFREKRAPFLPTPARTLSGLTCVTCPSLAQSCGSIDVLFKGHFPKYDTKLEEDQAPKRREVIL